MSLEFEDWIKKITLGTAQFGLDYGISNQSGRVSRHSAGEILRVASEHGIETLDTAVAYGDSQQIIGCILAQHPYPFDLVSKFPPDAAPDRFDEILATTLKTLGRSHLNAYLAHQFESFQQPSLRDRMEQAKCQGLIEQFGVSVYRPSEVKWLLDHRIDCDVVQLPTSVFDGRFRPLFGELKARSIKIHARSIFLQGLYYISPAELPTHFDSAREAVGRLHAISRSSEIPLSAILMNYAILQPEIDKIVIGVTSCRELNQNLDAFRYAEKCSALCSELDALAITDEQILLPFNWK